MIDLNYPQHVTIVNLALFIIVISFFLFYRYIYPRKSINLLFLLIIISILPTLALFRGGTFRSGDLTPHTVHLMSFYKNLQEGILIPRWAGDLCGSYGCPTFIVEYNLPYYLASFFHFIGFSFVDSIKIVMAAAYVISGVTMYFWAKSEFGKIAGFTAAIFYLFAPYHIINLQLRGGFGETVSFAFIPLLFLFAKKLIEEQKSKYFIMLALSVTGIILSQSNSAISALAILSAYAAILIFRTKKQLFIKTASFVVVVLYGLLMSAFYWITAWYEIRYTWWDTVTYGDFKPINEYLYSPALFGTLFQGNNGEYRLIVGYLHIIIVGIGLYLLLKNKFDNKYKAVIIYLLIAFFVLFFMMLSISDFIWKSVPVLDTFMMVWRLLVPIAFISSAIAGLVVYKWNNKYFVFIICFAAIIYTIPNWANRKMVPLSPEPFKHEFEFYSEYYDKNNPLLVKNRIIKEPIKGRIVLMPPKERLVFLKGKGGYSLLKRSQTEHIFIVNVEEYANILFNINYFPGWKVYANGKLMPINYMEPKYLGKIIAEFEPGLYEVRVSLEDTFVRKVALLVTLSSIFSLMMFASVKLLVINKFFK